MLVIGISLHVITIIFVVKQSRNMVEAKGKYNFKLSKLNFRRECQERRKSIRAINFLLFALNVPPGPFEKIHFTGSPYYLPMPLTIMHFQSPMIL